MKKLLNTAGVTGLEIMGGIWLVIIVVKVVVYFVK